MKKEQGNKKATAPVSSAPTDERRLPNQNCDISIPSTPATGKDIFSPLHTVDGQTLLAANLPPLRFVVQGLLPQGLFILAGSPKVGKSWLALLLAQCVAEGKALWGREAEAGTVLYLALEDSLSRLQARYGRYSAKGSTALHFAIRAKTLKDGLLEQVNRFIAQQPDTRLIIIDTMQHIRGNPTDKSCYVNDYNDMNLLRQITSQHDLALLLVTHTRKMDDADPLNRISGSTGLVGAVDGVLLLEKEERTGTAARLTVANRDTEGLVFGLAFSPACRWELAKEEKEASSQREDPLFSFLLALLAQHKSWRGTASELCELAAGYGLSVLPVTLAKQLRAAKQNLFSYYGIGLQFLVQGNQRLICLSLSNTAQQEIQ